MLLRLALTALSLLILIAVSARAPSHGSEPRAVVIGDSLGQGVALASGLKGFARVSVHIRGPKIFRQIASIPAGATAFVVIGSNDAESNIKGLERGIDAIVHAAEAKNIRLVWLGAPCVRRRWNAQSAALDEALRKRFDNTAVTYVSMHHATICSGQFFEPDGVHLKMKGYTYMWEKARRAAGWSSPSERTAGSTSTNEPTVVATTSSDHPVDTAAAAAGETSTASPPAPAPTTLAPTADTTKRMDRTAAPAGGSDMGAKDAAPRPRVVQREGARKKRALAPTVAASYVTDERFRN